jgi:hypothetical protein
MLAEMDKVYSTRIDAAAEHLDRMLSLPGVGIGLVSDPRRMEELMQIDIPSVLRPMPPQLPYTESGYGGSIGNYLMELRRYKTAEIKSAYLKKLVEAYRAISADEFSRKRDAYAAELTESQKELAGLKPKEDFIDRVSQCKTMPGTFMPVIGGGARNDIVLCRKEEDKKVLERVCVTTSVTPYYINEVAGGIRVLDDAPIKAIQMLLFDCTDQRLEDLIK